MNKAALSILSLAMLALSSCGISGEKQERMRNSLDATLNSAFLTQDEFVAFAPEVELRDIEKGESAWSSADGYHANFTCSFTDNGQSVHLSGYVGFDSEGFVARCDDGRYPIGVVLVLVDSERVPVSESPYNLSIFGGVPSR